MRIKVLLVGGRKVTREGLAVLLGVLPDIDVVGEADDLATAPRVAEATAIEVVVVLAGGSSPEFAGRIRALSGRLPGARVVVLLMQADGAALRRVFEAGVAGCLCKECASGELVTAIRAVHGGRCT
jgi:DNA-binding NarL/FixJ family response regulator